MRFALRQGQSLLDVPQAQLILYDSHRFSERGPAEHQPHPPQRSRPTNPASLPIHNYPSHDGYPLHANHSMPVLVSRVVLPLPQQHLDDLRHSFSLGQLVPHSPQRYLLNSSRVLTLVDGMRSMRRSLLLGRARKGQCGSGCSGRKIWS
jgi:hypothetical protein